jgi:transcriptional regulator with XRE-family HTH domain
MSEDWGAELTRRIAEEIKRLRGSNSGQWLSDRTAQLGHRVSRSTISEIETGKRQTIAIDLLIVLAAALEIAPIALIYPGPYTVDNRVEMLPGVDTRMIEAAQWFAGRRSSALPKMEPFRSALKVLDLLDQRNELLALLSEIPDPPTDESEPDAAAPQRNSILARVIDIQREIAALGGADEILLLTAMYDEAMSNPGKTVKESEFLARRHISLEDRPSPYQGGKFVESAPVSELPDDGR